MKHLLLKRTIGDLSLMVAKSRFVERANLITKGERLSRRATSSRRQEDLAEPRGPIVFAVGDRRYHYDIFLSGRKGIGG